MYMGSSLIRVPFGGPFHKGAVLSITGNPSRDPNLENYSYEVCEGFRYPASPVIKELTFTYMGPLVMMYSTFLYSRDIPCLVTGYRDVYTVN